MGSEVGLHYTTAVFILLSLVVTWTVVPRNARKHRSEVEQTRIERDQARRDAARQITELRAELRDQARDNEARQAQHESQLKRLANCIPDRTVRKQAQTVPAQFERNLNENLRIRSRCRSTGSPKTPQR